MGAAGGRQAAVHNRAGRPAPPPRAGREVDGSFVRRVVAGVRPPKMRFQPVVSATRADEEYKPQGVVPPPPPGANPRPPVGASFSAARVGAIARPPPGTTRFRPTHMGSAMSSRSGASSQGTSAYAAVGGLATARRGLPLPPPPGEGTPRPSVSSVNSLALASLPEGVVVAPPPGRDLPLPPLGRSSRPGGGRPRAAGEYLPRRLFRFSSNAGAPVGVPSQFERTQMLVQPVGSSAHGYSRCVVFHVCVPYPSSFLTNLMS